MRIDRQDDGIRIHSPAKVNLFLNVLGKRDDGFHEVETVMCPLSLCDELTLVPTDTPELELDIDFPVDARLPLHSAKQTTQSRHNGDLAWDIPSDCRNLIIRSLELLRQELGIKDGARIHLKKRIPAAAGLGGGSSNAAAAIVAGMISWGQWDRTLAVKIAEQIGSDVPFFLGNSEQMGIALATGRGEQCVQIASQPDLRFAVTHPIEGCSTQAIYAHFSGSERPPQKSSNSATNLIDELSSNNQEKIGAGLFNALQFSAAKLNHWIVKQLDLIENCGVTHALMSGSGSSCFALVADDAIEKRIRDAAHDAGIPRVFSARAWYNPSIEQQLSQWTG